MPMTWDEQFAKLFIALMNSKLGSNIHFRYEPEYNRRSIRGYWSRSRWSAKKKMCSCWGHMQCGRDLSEKENWKAVIHCIAHIRNKRVNEASASCFPDDESWNWVVREFNNFVKLGCEMTDVRKAVELHEWREHGFIERKRDSDVGSVEEVGEGEHADKEE